jgi:tetratricopeptide (TPR) repeat protein
MMTATRLFLVMAVLLNGGASAQSSRPDESSPRITRLEAWLLAVEQHRPGAIDYSVRLVAGWNQEQLRLIWIDARTIVSLVRVPDVALFSIPPESGASSPGEQGQQVSSLARTGSRQVLYTSGELRHLRQLAKIVSSDGTPGPENDLLKRGALLHADVAVAGAKAQSSPLLSIDTGLLDRPGPGGLTLFMNDGQRLGLQSTVSHWNMGRRLLDAVRPLDSKSSLQTRPDPAADDFVRRWYIAGAAYMTRIRNIELAHFTRGLQLFPDDPDLLFFAASAHESFAGVRTQAVMRSLKTRRGVSFGVNDEGAELRQAEQLYKRALERNPQLVEARIRLGRVLGLRGHHDQATEQLKQGLTTSEPLLQYYANLFLGAEFEALRNDAEARRSYERAAAIEPRAQSPLLGLSRLADQAGDRAAAREALARVLKLPPNDYERTDPWWVYEVAQSRDVDRLLADIRQRP